MDTQKELTQVKFIVETILESDIRARNDDKWLTYLVMRNFTNIYIKFEDFEKLPSFGSITRARRIIQNTLGKYQPTDPAVMIKRKIRQESVKEWVSKQLL